MNKEEKEQRLAFLTKCIEELNEDMECLGELMEVLVQLAKNSKSNITKKFISKIIVDLGICDLGNSTCRAILEEMVEIFDEMKDIAIELELPYDTYSWVDTLKEADKIDWNQHFGFSAKEDN